MVLDLGQVILDAEPGAPVVAKVTVVLPRYSHPWWTLKTERWL